MKDETFDDGINRLITAIEKFEAILLRLESNGITLNKGAEPTSDPLKPAKDFADFDEDLGRQKVDSFKCPVCQGSMRLRTAGRGSNAGQRFAGCAAYPECTGTRDLKGVNTTRNYGEAYDKHKSKLASPPEEDDCPY